jgi:serine/threonine protein kinase
MEVAWQNLGEVFQQVFDLPEEERQACLDALCQDDPALRGEVESLLRAHDLAEYFSRAGQDAAALLPAEGSSGLAASRRFGPYTVLRQLGQGGMGAVFLAARSDDEFDQLVAIKILRLPGPEGFERFRAERQVQANLEHPGIARLYGGGTSELGVPYIVMEYVEGGRPIDQHCDEHGLGVAARLELFGKVCAAVAFAHRNLVVHRDLKPSNILVTPRGEAKLLDFGISKLLTREAADWDPTGGGPGPLTPAYASPEQLLGQAITTSSDVFSLGVLLYTLLTGEPPFARSLAERLRQLAEQAEPPAPLHTARARPAAGASRAFLALDRGRRRDLEAILAKALAFSTGERYGSVEQLAADLESYRRGRPVLARRPTLSYRASRWLRRNWLVSGLAGFLLLFLAASSLALATQNRQVLRERDRAQEEAQKSERILGLLLEVFEGSDPAKTRGADISVRDVLKAAEPRIERELADQPQVRAALLESLGKVYFSLGSLDDAERLLGRARDLWLGNSPPGSAAGASALDHLAGIARQRGAFAEALAMLERARALRVAELGEGSVEEAAGLQAIADIQLLQNRIGEAESNVGRALEILHQAGEAGGKKASEAKIRARFTLGELLFRQAGRDAAVPAFEQALAEARRELGAEHPTTLALLLKLADLEARHPADFELAERYLRERIAALDRLYQGRDHPAMAVSLDVLGGILTRKGDFDGAKQAFERCLALRRRLTGESSPFLAVTLGNIGWLHLFGRGDWRQAEPLLRQGLAMAEEYFPPNASLLTYPLIGIGRCRVLAGDPAAGEPFLRRALAIRQAAPAPAPLEIARIELFLGECLAAQGRCSEAEKLLGRARALLEPAGDPDDLERLRAPAELFAARCRTDRNLGQSARTSAKTKALAPG